MHIDELGLDVSDIGQPPASLGDSMANTSRRVHLQLIIDFNLGGVDVPALSHFVTEKGYVRHPSPEMPLDQRENDMPSDQMLPWFLAMKRGLAYFWADQMKARLAASGYRDGKGNFITPAFYAVLKDSKFLLDMTLLGQALIFKLPFRWSDDKRLDGKWNKFVSSKDATGDYLNWFHAAVYASPWVRNMVSKERVFERICRYYADEPNCSALLNLYKQAIERVYGF